MSAEVVNMIKAYLNTLKMLKYLKIRLTRKQYTELAKRFNLLSIQSMQYISKQSYEKIIHDAVREVE